MWSGKHGVYTEHAYNTLAKPKFELYSLQAWRTAKEGNMRARYTGMFAISCALTHLSTAGHAVMDDSPALNADG